MKWGKLGKVFMPDDNHQWMVSHAANTVAEHLDDDTFKIYFSCRDVKNVSSVGFVVVDINPPFETLEISQTPVLSPGEIGLFDDSGTSLACITTIGGKKHMYYLGWNLMANVPWHNAIGLAVCDESTGHFRKISKAPLLDRCDADPYSLSYPFVMEDGDLLRMWYGSNQAWGKDQKDMAHLLKYAESTDGLHWNRQGKIALHFKNDGEYAMSRPCVIKENGSYKMWYSYRGEKYRIGYAESENGIDWERKDEQVGITVSQSGWDSEMICYPFVFDHKGNRYMLYNGNGYGKTGFGLAILEQE